MSLELDILQLFRRAGDKWIARCPACAEDGHDKKGEHLVIQADGRFGCVRFQGPQGRTHRKRIFELAGKAASGNAFPVTLPCQRPKDGFLGRLGRLTPIRPEGTILSKVSQGRRDPEKPVPSVPSPTPEVPCFLGFDTKERILLSRLDPASLEKVRRIKAFFGARVVAVSEDAGAPEPPGELVPNTAQWLAANSAGPALAFILPEDL